MSINKKKILIPNQGRFCLPKVLFNPVAVGGVLEIRLSASLSVAGEVYWKKEKDNVFRLAEQNKIRTVLFDGVANPLKSES